MIYVGMDVSSKSFVVHAINERNKVVFKGEVLPSRAGLASLMKRLGEEIGQGWRSPLTSTEILSGMRR